MRKIAPVVIMACSLLIFGANTQPATQSTSTRPDPYREAKEQAKADEIKLQEQLLVAIRKYLEEIKKEKLAPALRQQMIKDCNDELLKQGKRLAKIKQPEYMPALNLQTESLKIGSLTDGFNAVIHQVIDADNVLFSIPTYTTIIQTRNYPGYIIPRFEYRLHNDLFWVKMNTTGMVDVPNSLGNEDLVITSEDSKKKYPGAYIVTGTRTYKTAIGSRTVFVLEKYTKQ